MGMQATQTIYCPVNLPINFPLGLCDAWSLKLSWEKSLKDFNEVLSNLPAGYDPEAIKNLRKSIVMLEGKIADIQIAIDSAKQAYGRSQVKKS
jgi:hypothetical protein